MNTILLIEDDQALTLGIKMALENSNTRVLVGASIEEARKCTREENIDLVILDRNLPDGDGLDFMREIKKQHDMLVILLTAKDLETDIVTGLSLGADDYVTKPFSLAVLRARVEVQLRKKDIITIFSEGDYKFDFEYQIFKKGNKKINLSQTEQKILKLLVKHKGRVVSREQLEAFVWGEGFGFVDVNTLSVAVRRLRSKLEDETHIQTIYGYGYVWKESVDE